MRPRLKIAEMFSTFAHFDYNSDARWSTDNKLRRSIENCLSKSSSPESDQFWSLYWYKIWRNNAENLAFMHLSAYLQEPCYWAAKNIMKKFYSTKYELADYFQMGIAEVQKICNGFKPEKNVNLKTYATIAFLSLLKEILRQRQDVHICTDWALLRKVTKKRFVEALVSAGLTSEEIARYKLAWKCFQALYIQQHAGGIERLPEPSRKLWSEIANLYNRERQSQLVSASRELDGEMVEQWLRKTATWIRSYLYPTVDSLDVPKPGSNSPGHWDLPELTSESLMTELIAQENTQESQNRREEIHNFLLAALKQLTPELREVLQMYYQQDLTQQEIARRLGKDQVWVSRKLSKSRKILLEELTKWEQKSEKSQQGVNVSPDPNLLKDRSDALEEWLRVRKWF
ncbi:sigma-70 family RNA polymerase sigma factor [Iningainema tapete]|uniref:Sigma-70 family RNA polymerase sigma factor n=1 Tax=Iningainema tapete BLCC-T55 TaxID=2748662 RepID=A0A8J6XJB2_9CYAN|nr:sigma-70 family RNA polymerase sigma factor [Iningainema tapete]MBD2771322.1 sigma-70 family RNA polymerase sigma factor [Iningainema tapete BLCC-T55]